MTGFEQSASRLRPSKFRQFANLGRSLLGAWDKQWAGIERGEPHAAGQGTLCNYACVPCCYVRWFCSLSDVAAITQDAPSGYAFFTKDTLRIQLTSRGSFHDQTWQDDRQDFQSLAVPLSFPAEGMPEYEVNR